jgi:menaquinol-cytochrome c reductase iron-sulfur subunit
MMAVPLFRFAISPLSHPGGAADWFSLGPVGEFKGTDPMRADVEVRKVDGWRVTTAKQTVWVTHDGSNQLRVLSAVCPHLGCIVPWSSEQKSFVCPCHDGRFAKDGSRLSGPPPRGLDPLPIKTEGGNLYVRYEYFRQLSAKSEVIG